jgi:oligo-1,6-glucosidase
MEGKKMLVLLNFSAKNAKTDLNVSLVDSKPLLSNYPDGLSKENGPHEFSLRPYEALVFQLQ